MSQGKNSNNALSPVREQSNRRVNLGQLSPFQMLRMLSKMPQEGPSFKDIPIEETTTKPHDPLQYIPAKRNYESEFYSKFNTIPLLDHNQRAAKDLGPNKFWERKRRHADMTDNESFVAHSSTNYSRLDYKPTPLSRTHLDDVVDDDDDNRTWRTQDMLSEDEDNAVVLDAQRIQELRQTLDEQFIRESLLRSQRQMESQSRESSQILAKLELPESSQETTTTTQEPVNNDIKLPIVKDTQLMDEKRTLSPQPSVHSTMDLGAIREKINNLPEAPGFNLDDQDWGDDFGQDWSDNELNQIVEEGDTNIEPGIKVDLFTLIPHTRPREIFSNKLGYNTRLSVQKTKLIEISNLFFEQLIKDIKVQKRRTPETMDCVTNEDIIQVMKRQQVLDAKTTVEQLAHKHLPRELTEAICTSALEQNILNPRKRRLLLKNQN